MTDPYGRIAELYDWEHDDFDDDLPLYRRLVERTGHPILELGCGTGRVIGHLAREGYRCYGVDRSAAMLARARARSRAAGTETRLTLLESGMEAFQIPEPARMAIIALDSFGHVEDREAQLATLRAVRSALVPGGLMVLDLSNGNLRGEARDELQHHLTAEDPSTGDLITKWVARVSDSARQCDDFTVWYDRTSPDGTIRRITVEFTLRYFTRFELELLLERAGFVVEQVYGSYDLDGYSASSERLIAVARAEGG